MKEEFIYHEKMLLQTDSSLRFRYGRKDDAGGASREDRLSERCEESFYGSQKL